MARLIVSPGTAQAREVILKVGVNSIGRAPANDVTIDDGSVSGSHCQLIVSDGTVRLRDVGSTNGTLVNDRPVVEADLAPGHRIQVGRVQLMFAADDSSNASAQAETVAAVPTPPPLPASAPRTVARLRIAHEPDAPQPEEASGEAAMPLEEDAPGQVQAPARALCKYHTRTPARWLCAGCHKTFCDLCVASRPGTGGAQKFCRGCGATCNELQLSFEAPKEKTFFSELPRAVIYPFRGTGVLVLIVTTIVFAALEFLSAGWAGILIKMAALGYVFSYVQNIIHSTASGDDKLPELPAMEGLFGSFFRLAGTLLVSFGPALVAAYLAIAQEMPAAGIALIPTIVFGCLYFPMAFLAVAIKDNVFASNPLVVVPSILRVPLEYIVAAILLSGMFGVRWLGDAISGEMGHRALRTESISEMLLLFGLRMLWAFLSVYLLTVTMRILGLLYLTKRDRLGW